jgi:hypothetical protein
MRGGEVVSATPAARKGGGSCEATVADAEVDENTADAVE